MVAFGKCISTARSSLLSRHLQHYCQLHGRRDYPNHGENGLPVLTCGYDSHSQIIT